MLKVLLTKQLFLSGGSIQSSMNLGEALFPNNARINNRIDLNQGEVVYTSINHLVDLLNDYYLYFDGVTLQTSHQTLL